MSSAVWENWSDISFEATQPARVAAIASEFRSVINHADIVGMPDAETLRLDNQHFGPLAEMQRAVIRRSFQSFASFRIAEALHELMPFLRLALKGQTFLGFVGSSPDLVGRLGHFCGIANTQTMLVPPIDDKEAGSGCFQHIDRALADFVVLFWGAIFLVGLPGPYGLIFCGRLKTLGAIALDIGAVASGWAKG